MPDILLIVAALSLLAWLYLGFARGGFWRADQRLPDSNQELVCWPMVTAVIPARNEAEGIGAAITSLLSQDYPGHFRIVIVDDNSSDGTARIAAAAAGDNDRVHIIRGQRLPSGWTGKLWAVQQGIEEARTRWPETQYLLLTDADINHHASKLRRLVIKAVTERHDLVSLMVRLRCQAFWERLLIPAFVFFFQKLYPFPLVNDPSRPEAAAAGGCMLVRLKALDAAGGIEAIRDRLIDDCALAARIKALRGSIWLGLSDQTHSLRPYTQLRSYWSMVARTAFTQLQYSWRRLILTVVGMTMMYVTPPVAVVAGLVTPNGWVVALGGAAWALMMGAFRPTVKLYRLSVVWVAFLPIAAVLHVLMTVDSARRTWLGRGGAWKGRTFDSACAKS